MPELRERWTGVSLPGDYLLQHWLSGDESAAFFQTTVAPDGPRAVVKLIPESAVNAAARLALWQRTRALQHPNLLRLLDCGSAELAGEVAIYAVFEHADDTLAGALAQAPLTEAEAREVLDAVLPALAYLKGEGLALPALDPDQVVGVGDAIKLSTEQLREAPADLASMDELRAFWKRISPSTPIRSAEILAEALGTGSRPAPVPDRAAIAAPPVARPAASPAGKSFPKWPLVAAAAVVVVIAGYNLRPAPETPAQPAPAPPVSEPAAPKPSPLEVRKSPPHAARPGTWRVIAFTARSHDGAARVAEQINGQHPDLHAAVFSPPEKAGYFLVSLGAPMRREDAVRLQTKARAANLGRGVYIKKFLD